MMARAKEWNIFAPKWDHLAQYPALSLGSLCAMSVGLHPYFSSPSWVFNIAMPHFNGTNPDEFWPVEDTEEGARRTSMLDLFLQRVHVAAGNLAPYGELSAVADSIAADQTVIKVADLVTLADGLGWDLPNEFPRPWATSSDSEPPAIRAQAQDDDRGYVSDKLSLLNQAARQWWANADRHDPGTHHKNADVVAWLIDRGMSETLAARAATIIRPEWAHLGRKPDE